jgi:hypothetical protein
MLWNFLQRENWELNNTLKKDDIENRCGRCVELNSINIVEKFFLEKNR